MNTEEIIEGYLGNTEVNSIYQGSELIWANYFNNKYMIGGWFTTPKNKIIRLNYDDSVDDTWYNNNSYTSGTFYDLKYDNINKKVYAAGSSAFEGGLVRFNLDGTKDSSFNIGTGFDGDKVDIIDVWVINIDNTNSKIYVGGEFRRYNGNTQKYIVRLNMNGTKDNTFNIGNGFDSTVRDIIIDTINQKIYAGGFFDTYNGSTRNGLARLNMNGSLDTSFNVGTGFDGGVYALNLDTINQKLYVGGRFATYNGSTRNCLVRLNMNGSLDTSFNIGTGFGIYGTVNVLEIDTINQKLYVGGSFGIYNGSSQRHLVRLNMDGTKDTSFNIGTGFDNQVYALNLDTINQKLYVGGYFTTYNGSGRNRIVRLNLDGSLDNTFNIQLNNAVHTILKYKI